MRNRLLRVLLPSDLVRYRVPTAERCVYLTFDDGPHPKNTPRILDALKQYNAFATFFLIGKEAEAYPELVRRIVTEGHALGTHTQNHADLSKTNLEETGDEIMRCHRVVETASGQPTPYFRPPWGRFGLSVVRFARKHRLQIVMWTTDSQEWKLKDAPRLIERFKSQQRVPGEILLFHDDYDFTVEALPALLEHLIQQGYTSRALPGVPSPSPHPTPADAVSPHR